jgi:D-sedoheptulose 7-phosphate isomerase
VQLQTHEPLSPAARPGYAASLSAALLGRRRLFGAALELLASEPDDLAAFAERIVSTLAAGRKVLVLGNGGSAAEAQHFAAELVGRFLREREPYAVIALTTDTAILTAVGNDYGYDQVFARQVRALGRSGDLLVTFSTSGASPSVLRAVEDARAADLYTVGLTGARTSELHRLADLTIRVPVAETAAIQELHKVITHLVCELVEESLGHPPPC